jgi:small subunit ribosomal protein S20
MANTKQAKKRIRRNANREAINGARVSRIRTFIKAAESALESGNKDEAAKALRAAQRELARIQRIRSDRPELSRLSKRLVSLS